MGGMRSDRDQLDGLRAVAQRVKDGGGECMIDQRPGDVPTLASIWRTGVRAEGPRKGQVHVLTGWVEVVHATGPGYDVWRRGHLAEVAVSAEVAAQAVMDDCRRMKALCDGPQVRDGQHRRDV